MRHGHAILREPDGSVPEPRPEQASTHPEQLLADSQTQVVPRQSQVAEQIPVLPDHPFPSEMSSSDASVAERQVPFPDPFPDAGPDRQDHPRDCSPGSQDVAAGRLACAAVHPQAVAAHCTSVAVQSAASPRAAEPVHSQPVLQKLLQRVPQRREQQALQLEPPQPEPRQELEQQPQASPPPAQPEAQPQQPKASCPQAA